MMKKMSQVLCVCVALALVGGCGTKSTTSQETSGKTFITHTELEQEYRDSIKKLEFPKGFKVPQQTTEEIDATFQRGYGNTVASYTWQCAWQKEWLERYASDSDRANRALKVLEKAPSMPYLDKAHADDATRRIFKENIDKAKLGDPSGIQEDVSANCK
ncbi:hypothetical protein J2S49_001705 [Arcanobacterium wilhelmae]|uniref:Lipoprotein n=1 Tax=Arcanobacterium wilhelmae TaxID=1803177 RepID=A0ABT9ND28_9ACTO|nr:hypothetical protein [Arcanobacterium wilhelmae]MDP9801629.1 hypothetical protein [Arcanobacterium wilhelmae]WFN90951.1 hypothetical protein P8A24_03620 [Arcanobacterium wilhelmae]